MADNFLNVGTDGANAAFGTGDVEYSGIGTIVSGGNNLTGDKFEAKGRNGGVIFVVYFNEKNECEIEAIFDSEVELPVRGDSLSLMGLTNVLCDEVKIDWKN